MAFKEKVLIVQGEEGRIDPLKLKNFFNRIITRTKDSSGQSFEAERDFIFAADWNFRKLLKAKPKAILAVGERAHREVIGTFTNWKGKKVRIDELRGFVFDGPEGIPTIGTYHPNFLLTGNFHLARVSQLDLLRTVEVARLGRPERIAKYLLRPSAMDAKHFLDSYEAALAKDLKLTLAFDIETPYGSKAEKDDDPYDFAIEDDASYTILRISFSFREDEAITFPWTEPFISIAKRLLASPGLKVSYNGLAYDIPRLEASGFPVLGPQVDGMHLWKCFEPAFPMSLRFVVSMLLPDADQWKLKVRENEELYSCKDSDYLLRCFNKIKTALEREGRWEMFLRHFVDCGIVLRRMTSRGIKVNQEARAEARRKIEGWLEEKVKEIQPLVPFALKPKKIFKLGLETLMKKGHKREDFVLVADTMEELPKNKILNSEGLLVSALKLPKLPKPVKPARKKKRLPSSSDSLTLPE